MGFKSSRVDGLEFSMLLVLAISVLTIKVWFFGSIGTSAVKAISGSCGKEYFLESIPVISGNWFCAK